MTTGASCSSSGRCGCGTYRYWASGGCSRWPSAQVFLLAPGSSSLPSATMIIHIFHPTAHPLRMVAVGRSFELTRINACPYTPQLTSGRPKVCGPADYLVKAWNLGAREERTKTLCSRLQTSLLVPL